MNKIIKAFLAINTVLAFLTSATAFAEEKHFNEKGKPPSVYTVEKQNEWRKTLPFEDKQDFEENKRGFIAAALELRSGIPGGASLKTVGPDMVKAMSTELFLDFLGVRVDSRKAEGMDFTINLVTPDNGEKFVVEMSNATLTNIKNYQAKDADLTITVNRSDLEPVMMGKITFDEQVKAGKVKLEGNREVYDRLVSTFEQFDPSFEIMPGTKEVKAGEKELSPFEMEQPALSGE